MTPATNRKAAPAVFATAQFARSEVRAGHTCKVPASEAHAKRMGSTMTMCGLRAWTWHKFWDLGFRDVRGKRCPNCTAAFVALLKEERVC